MPWESNIVLPTSVVLLANINIHIVAQATMKLLINFAHIYFLKLLTKLRQICKLIKKICFFLFDRNI